MPYVEEIYLRGHIIDSLILPRTFDTVMDLGGDFDVLEINVGKHKDDPSFAHLRIRAESDAMLAEILDNLMVIGAEVASTADAQSKPAPKDGALPPDFYSTTNLPTEVRVDGEWIPVADIEMDVAIVLDRERRRAKGLPMAFVSAGEQIVVGHEGVRVHPLERSRDTELGFSFMNSDVSSEKPKRLVIEEIGAEIKRVKAEGKRVIVVGGPAIIHTGAAAALAALIRAGYVDALLGGNAIAVHDVEAALYGTSLGVNLKTAAPVEGGHHHHMRAINTIRLAGGLREAVEQGILTEGVMYEAIKADIDLVLAGSIRDDGPLPDVITDVLVAQQTMREAVQNAGIALMIGTMLHSIATGNMLPAHVRTVAVDINPAMVTKLADRGSWQAIALVTDAELFLLELAEVLGVGR
ncbi:MAG: TIGR00300 family protein [Anaerolineales bacterium]|nr:TIGR00300 family protein [Anaerolineales bacterium]MCB9128024.1 TIGR00300 family protein [Ardenticatenales bacterium]MCB9172040.1 TIGR00300 family protein [Ardenticatenales bacterium]